MTTALTRSIFFLILALGLTALGAAERLDSRANTDGVLTWQLGSLEPGKSARQVVLFAFDDSYEKVTSLLEQARRACGSERGSERGVVWIKNAVTDFALDAAGAFFWEGKRQSLTCSHGGQLSRFGYYVHYHDGAARRAGTPILQGARWKTCASSNPCARSAIAKRWGRWKPPMANCACAFAP